MDNFNPTQRPATGLSLNGILPTQSLAQMQADERRQAEETNSTSYITNLASHVRMKWSQMRQAKLSKVEPRLLQCLRQRRGEYDPDKLAMIQSQGGSAVYMMLSSNKSRALSSWIRDAITGNDGSPLPYALSSTPDPQISPDRIAALYTQMQQELVQVQQLGIEPTPYDLECYVSARKEMLMNQVREEADQATDRMKLKMDDQLIEGGAREEFNKFIDDIATFPYAVMKGPVVVKQKTFKWFQEPDGQYSLSTTDELIPTWSRVDPFMIYWSADAAHPEDGDLIERHRLSRQAIYDMIGVDGYSEPAIRAVLQDYGSGGLHEWLWIDSAKAQAEGKHLSSSMNNQEGLIDALQYWGSVQGQTLLDWGLDESTVEDPDAEYPIEAWLIGNWVIKAIVNPDPLARKPYYKASYEEIPGAWCGNSPLDLIRDCQDVCNSAARALINNMGIASGPQVWMNVDRLPAGEQITQMFPWKIWQFGADQMGNSAPPIDFFQPNSMAQELMAIYQQFSTLADEYSGVPRYMTGDAAAGGAGRTASGMSMMMNNAGKSIKQVIANIDRYILEPLAERLWFYNMKYSDDPDLKGDVKVVARGASALLIKDAVAQRRNELLQMALTNPTAQQIMGIEGTAYLMREQVKTLDMNGDKIVPPPEVVKARMQVQQAEQLQQQMMLAQQQHAMGQPPVQQQPGQPSPMQPQGTPPNPAKIQGPTSQSGQNLEGGAPVMDTFSPMRH